MEHIDEGTIHAWLDEALPPDEGARVEQHVRACADCAAAVAEARGLIAASSRILSALDDVPRDVVPRRVDEVRADSAPSVRPAVRDTPAAPVGTAPVRRRRSWWQRPQFAAAAGIAFVAVALSVVWQRSPQRTVSDFAGTRASEPAMAPAAAAPEAASAPVGGAAPNAAPSAALDAVPPRDAAVTRESKETEVSAGAGAAEQARPGGRADGPRAKAAPQNDALADANTRTRRAGDVAGNVATPPAAVPPAPTQESVERTDMVRRAAAPPAAAPTSSATVATKAVAPPPAARALPVVGGATAPVADSAPAKRQLAITPDAITRSEKARVQGERGVQSQSGVVAGGAGAEARASEARRDLSTVEGIVGCYRLDRRGPALDAGVAAVIALLREGQGTFDGDTLRVARLVGVAPSSTTEWRWTLSARGDVSLVRVQGAAYARFPLALRVAAQTGETSVATRVTCPGR